MTNDYLSAEYAVVGSVLLDADCIDEILAICSVDDFNSEICKSVIETAAEQKENGKPFDAVLCRELLKERWGFDYIGEFLAGCIEATTTTANCVEYARLVKQRSMECKIADIAARLRMDVASSDWQETANSAICELQDAVNAEKQSGVVRGREWAEKFIEKELAIVDNPDAAFCRTGLKDLDDVLAGGMFRGGLYVVGARPGIGKTTVALNIAENVARSGKTVLFVSLEMTDHQIMCKRISIEYALPYKSLMNGRISQEDLETVQIGAATLADRPFVMNGAAGLTVNDISLLCRKIGEVDLLVIDYLGLIQPPENSNGSRYEDYTKISGDLKQLAIRLNIPILCLSQLNRQNTQRANKEPSLSDLRDTGAVEQDADAVILLHRDSYYETTENKPDMEVIKMIVAKNRHGDTGLVRMSWQGSSGTISSFDYKHEDYGRQGVEREVLPF